MFKSDKCVLHIHQDYPDNTSYSFTKAVSNLVHASQKAYDSPKHFVVSINRTSNPFKVRCRTFQDGISVIYWGVPLPYFHILTLWLAAWMIRRAIPNLSYDLVHGHKLTTEGVLARFLAQAKSVPYFISIRGGSDQYNITRLPNHKRFFKKVFEEAAFVFWVSPWAARFLTTNLGVETGQLHHFPNICEIDLAGSHSEHDLPTSAPPLTASPETDNTYNFVAVMSYTYYRRKGIEQLMEALRGLQAKGYKNISLSVYGNGDEHNRQMLIEKAQLMGLSQHIEFHKAIHQSELRQKMRASHGMLLPSVDETFGMSYIEALSVNCPILYMANTGVDGFFDKYDVGVRALSQSPEELERAILQLMERQQQFKRGILQMHQNSYLNAFLAETLVNDYKLQIEKVIS